MGVAGGEAQAVQKQTIQPNSVMSPVSPLAYQGQQQYTLGPQNVPSYLVNAINTQAIQQQQAAQQQLQQAAMPQLDGRTIAALLTLYRDQLAQGLVDGGYVG